MNDLRKAAEMALEALDSFHSDENGTYDTWTAYEALRQALAQPEQKPVAWRNVIPGGRMTDKWDSGRVADYNQGWNDYRKAAETALEKLDTTPQPPALAEPANSTTGFVESKALAQPEQEPVKWINFNAATGQESIDDYCDSELASIPLYMAPQKREWVGVTDQEIIDHFQTNVDTGSLLSFADGVRYAEAKLEEKNT